MRMKSFNVNGVSFNKQNSDIKVVNLIIINWKQNIVVCQNEIPQYVEQLHYISLNTK